MKRRTFIQNSLTLGLTTALAPQLLAGQQDVPDLVVASGTKPDDLFSVAMNALGGFKQFNMEGKRILVKPSILWDAPPDSSLNSSPALISRIIRDCYHSGAWEVYVTEHTIDNWEKCYKNSGIEEATKRASGKIKPANDSRFYSKDPINGIHLHELVEKCDMVINVPKLSYCEETGYTASVKNLLGLTSNRKCDTQLAQLLLSCKPILNILEASVLVKGQTRQVLNLLVAGCDALAVDAWSFKTLGLNPYEFSYLLEASQLGLGSMNTEKLSILKIYT